MRIRRILLAAVPALIILAVIFRFSSQDRAASTQTSRAVARAILEVVKTEEMTPGSAAYLGTLHEIQVVLRKIAHGVEFAALGLTLALVTHALRLKRRRLWAWLACAGAAVLDEVHQLASAARTPRVMDVVIDCAGALIGIWLAGVLIRLAWRIRRRKKARSCCSVTTTKAELLTTEEVEESSILL